MIRTTLTVCFICVTFVSFNTVAMGAREKTESDWRSVFIAGASFSGKTDYTTKAGNVSLSSNDQANAQALLGAEVTYQPSAFPIGGSIVFEGTRYKYKDAGGTADGQKALLFMPRIAGKVGPAEIWAGMGLGLMFMSIGGPTTTTVNNITATLLDTSVTSFAWSPRVGADFDVNPNLFMGAQFSYIQFAGTVNWTATASGMTIPVTQDFTRHWLSAALRVGVRF